MKLDKVIAVRTNKTVYRDGHLAIKVFDSDYSKADVLNEALNQARVEETALNIPRLHEVCTVGGKWAIVSDFIPGKTLARLMEENPDRRDEYMDLFVDLQLKMHAQTCPLLGKLKDKMNRKIDETGLDATTRYELHARLQGMPNHKKLCHGDFDPNNIILRDDGEAFILDWSHATQGNARCDKSAADLPAGTALGECEAVHRGWHGAGARARRWRLVDGRRMDGRPGGLRPAGTMHQGQL